MSRVAIRNRTLEVPRGDYVRPKTARIQSPKTPSNVDSHPYTVAKISRVPSDHALSFMLQDTLCPIFATCIDCKETRQTLHNLTCRHTMVITSSTFPVLHHWLLPLYLRSFLVMNGVYQLAPIILNARPSLR